MTDNQLIPTACALHRRLGGCRRRRAGWCRCRRKSPRLLRQSRNENSRLRRRDSAGRRRPQHAPDDARRLLLSEWSGSRGKGATMNCKVLSARSIIGLSARSALRSITACFGRLHERRAVDAFRLAGLDEQGESRRSPATRRPARGRPAFSRFLRDHVDLRIAKCALDGDRRAGAQYARVLRVSEQHKIQGLFAQVDRAGRSPCCRSSRAPGLWSS